MKKISEVNSLEDLLPDKDDWERAAANQKLFVALKDYEESLQKAIEICHPDKNDVC